MYANKSSTSMEYLVFDKVKHNHHYSPVGIGYGGRHSHPSQEGVSAVGYNDDQGLINYV